MWQISYPPANGASQDKFVKLIKSTDRQSDEILTPFTGGCVFFFFSENNTSPTRFARRGIIPPLLASLAGGKHFNGKQNYLNGQQNYEQKLDVKNYLQ